jgi:predicted DNA binding protein
MKFKVFDEKGIYSLAVQKSGVSLKGFPLNYYEDKENYYFIATGFVNGDEKSKRKFFSILKKNRLMVKLEKLGNYFLIITKLSKSQENKRFVHNFYDPRIIHSKPTIIYSDGWEENEVISFDRKILEDLIKISESVYKFNLMFLKKEKFNGISVLQSSPFLAKKQKQAIQLAIDSGYYTFPRKTDLDKLSRGLKVNKSTFRESLRRAENKLIPFLVDNF